MNHKTKDLIKGDADWHEIINKNFSVLEQNIVSIALIDGKEGQIADVSTSNGKEVGVGSTIYYTDSSYKFVSVDSKHRILVNEDGVYCFIMQAWGQIPVSHNGYFYMNTAKNGVRAGGQDRLFGTGADALKNRQDGTGMYIGKFTKGDTISALIETNYTGKIDSAGIKSVVVVKVGV
ncbi:hypothetical protein [Enterococcus faecalis]|uniref:hypothetical protein n=1 Tax=Enterococcus faecalis TaxID=1351 RepID=UPI001891E28F|nr:hypothetical protein [Enterococcus faecalis]QPB60499.1 hypothetical protein GFB65_10665 [Enterococcus faecalis]